MRRPNLTFAVILAGLVCGCQPPAEEPPAPAPAVQPKAEPNKKATALVVRSVRPTDDSATANRGFVVSYGLTSRDLDQIVSVADRTDLVVPMRFIPSDVKYLDRTVGVRVVATVASYTDVNTVKMSAGRFLTKDDDADKENVCVLGAAVAAELFPKDDPVGQTVNIRGHYFRVVGVVKERPAAEGAERDVYVPLRTSRARFGDIIRDKNTKENQKVEFHEIVVRPKKPDDLAEVEKVLREILEKNHAMKDWEVVPR